MSCRCGRGESGRQCHANVHDVRPKSPRLAGSGPAGPFVEAAHPSRLSPHIAKVTFSNPPESERHHAGRSAARRRGDGGSLNGNSLGSEIHATCMGFFSVFEGVSTARHPQPTTVRGSTYASIPKAPNSRPRPDSLKPPNGASGSSYTPLMNTRPATMRSAIRFARVGSLKLTSGWSP